MKGWAEESLIVTHVIGFSFIPNIRTIDNKVREKGDKKIGPKIIIFPVERGFKPWPLTWMLFWLLYSLDSMLVYGQIQIPFQNQLEFYRVSRQVNKQTQS